MAKAKKIDVKNMTLNEINENIFAVQSVEGEEETPFASLNLGIHEMLKEGNKFNVKITKARNKSGKPSEKKPIFKMLCPTCGKKIKTNEENLKIECVDCKVEYVLEEEK